MILAAGRAQRGIQNGQTVASIQKYIYRMHKNREDKVSYWWKNDKIAFL